MPPLAERAALYERRSDSASLKSMIFLVVVGLGDAEVVVAAKVDIVVGRILALVDILQFFVGQVGIRFLGLLGLLHLLERNRLLGLEHRLRSPLVAALDADDRIVLAEIVEPFTALGAVALVAPLWLDHGNVLICPPLRQA